MRTPTAYGVAAAFALLLQACAASPGAEASAPARQGEQALAALSRDTAAPIQTEKLAYRDTMFIEIVATYRNRTGSTVLVDECGRRPPKFVLQKQMNGRWITAYDKDCVMIGVREPFTVAPGGVYTDTITVIHDIFNADAWQVNEVPGVYRLVYMLRKHEGEAKTPLLPESERVSNPFRITAP